MSGWFNRGLRMSDHGVYLRGVITDEQKIVLAANQSPTAMDETIEQLAARLPYAQPQIKAARAAMERDGIVTLTPVLDLTSDQLAAPGWRRGRKILAVDERFTKMQPARVFVAGEAVQAVIDVTRRGVTPALILLMAYTRVQAITGVAFAYESALRRDFAYSSKVVKRANAILKESGVMQQVDTFSGTPVYVLSSLPSDPAGATLSTIRRNTTQRQDEAPAASDAVPF